MGKRIYAGNLPWSVTKARLDEIFSPFGEIEESLVIANRYTGKSRGFGFVTYKKDSDAEKAIREMNKKEVEGRVLVVKEAIPLTKEENKEKHKEQHGKEIEEEMKEETEKEMLEEKPKKRGRKKKEKNEEELF